MELIKNEPLYLDYILSQMYVIEDLQYFDNIKKYPGDVFVLGLYNFTLALKEHNKHLALCLTKVPYDSCAMSISNSIRDNICTNNSNNSEGLELFLKQFMLNSNTEQYYKKFSVSMPVDKLCNDICQTLLDKSWSHSIASLATFEFVIMAINGKLNEYAKNIKKDEAILLSEKSEYSIELVRLLDQENKSNVKSGVTDILNSFCALFNEINNLYYSD